jgi:hypothetical protein
MAIAAAEAAITTDDDGKMYAFQSEERADKLCRHLLSEIFLL